MPTWTFEIDPDGLPLKPPPVTMAGQELHPSQAIKVEALIADCILTAQCRHTAIVGTGLRVTDLTRGYERAIEKAKAVSEHWMAYVCHRAHTHLWDIKQQGIADPDGPSLSERVEAPSRPKGKAAALACPMGERVAGDAWKTGTQLRRNRRTRLQTSCKIRCSIDSSMYTGRRPASKEMRSRGAIYECRGFVACT